METLHTIFSQEIVQRFGWTLVHFVWQAAAIGVILATVLKLLYNASSNLRYITACAALALIVLMPAVTVMTVNVSIAGIAPAKPAVNNPPKTGMGTAVITTELPNAKSLPAAAAASAGMSLKDKVVDAVEPALPYLVIGWLTGVFGLSLWHLGGWRQLQRLRRQSVRPVMPALKTKLQQLSDALGIHRAIRLAESALVQVPTVIGHLKPVILLPASALTGLSPEQIEAILAHELAHIKRCDYLVNLLQTIVEILGFYHPAVWWVSRKIRIERENCCDDIAVSLCSDRVCYAKALTTMEEIRAGQSGFAVAASGGNLFDRIRRLLGKDAANDAGKSRLVPVAAILIMAFIFVLTSCQYSQKSASLSSWNSKIERLDIDKAGRDDVIRIFGEPTKYVWGMQQVFDKNALPARYVMAYPEDFHVFVAGDRVIEVRFEGPSNYVFGSGLAVGSSAEKVFSVLGQPAEVVDGKPNDFRDDVFYKNIDGKKGYGYYARPDKNVRLWMLDNKVKAIYLTRSKYSAGGGTKLKEAEILKTGFIDEKGHIVDKVDYPFVNDPDVIGGWKSVDFVRVIDDFDPDKKSWPDDLYLNNLVFEEGGDVAGNLFKWTKGLVLSEDTASRYTIRDIKGSQYLFYEWKTGDYTVRHMKPSYYVLKKVPVESLKDEPMFGKKADIPETSTINEKGYIVDKIDYPFIDDPEVIGTWKCVDYVGEIEQFKAGKQQWTGRGGKLFLHEMIFKKDGTLISKNDTVPNGFLQTWTKGLVFYDKDVKTASKYIIQEKDGSQYLFCEWKSGDYTFRRMKPKYFVLKKILTPAGLGHDPSSEDLSLYRSGENSPQLLTTSYILIVPADLPELKEVISEDKSKTRMIGPEELDTFLSAVRNIPQAKMICAPKLLTNDDESGEISTGNADGFESIGLHIKNSIQPDRKTLKLDLDFNYQNGQDATSISTQAALVSNHAIAVAGGFGKDQVIVLLVKPEIMEKPFPKTGVIAPDTMEGEVFRIADIRFDPIRQGKNTVRITVENKSDKNAFFGVNVYSRSVDYGPQGVGWGTTFYEKFDAGQTRELRYVYKIQGPVTKNTYTRLWFYNARSLEHDDNRDLQPFAKKQYTSDVLEKFHPADADLKPVSKLDSKTFYDLLEKMQTQLRNKDYEGAWGLFSDDYKNAEYQTRGLDALRRQMEPTHELDSAFGWEKEDFLSLKAAGVERSGDTCILSAVTNDGQKWTLDFVRENEEWKLDWIAGYTPRVIQD